MATELSDWGHLAGAQDWERRPLAELQALQPVCSAANGAPRVNTALIYLRITGITKAVAKHPG